MRQSPIANDLPDTAIPWGNVVQFFGRGDAIPPLVDALWAVPAESTGARAAVAKHLAGLIAHQDGLIQATPFAVAVILSRMAADLARGAVPPIELTDVLAPVAAAAGDRLGGAVAADLAATPSLRTLMSPPNLWPDFVSDEEDEMLYEDEARDFSPQIWCAFHSVTAQLLNAHRASIAAVAKPQAGDRWQGILTWIDGFPALPPLAH